MKKVILSILLAISLFSVVYAYEQNLTYSYGSFGSQIAVTSLRYEPYPAEPGEIFTIYLIVKDIGTDYASNAACRIVNNFPFSSYVKNEEIIGPLAPGLESLINFEIRVDPKAVERTEELEIQCSGNLLADSWNTYKIPIKIQSRYTILNVIDVRTDPSILPIGKQGKVMFKLSNNAESVIKDVLVQLDFANSKLAPASGITQQKISNIEKGEAIDVAFDVYTLPNAEPGMYLVPLNINYTTIQGDLGSFSTFATVRIGDKPSYYIIVESIDDAPQGSLLTLKFVNSGKSDLQFFNLKILESKHVSLKSNDQIYVGDLDSDDFLTETFIADITRSKTIIQTEATYEDTVGNNYKDYVNITFDKSRIINNSKSSIIPVIILLLALGGIGYYFYKKRKVR